MQCWPLSLLSYVHVKCRRSYSPSSTWGLRYRQDITNNGPWSDSVNKVKPHFRVPYAPGPMTLRLVSEDIVFWFTSTLPIKLKPSQLFLNTFPALQGYILTSMGTVHLKLNSGLTVTSLNIPRAPDSPQKESCAFIQGPPLWSLDQPRAPLVVTLSPKASTTFHDSSPVPSTGQTFSPFLCLGSRVHCTDRVP